MLRSLHGRLLAWLVIPLLFMSVAHLYSTYTDTQRTAEVIFDKLMVTLALTITEHALATGGDLLTEDLLELIHATTNDSLYYKVIGPGGSFVMGYAAIPDPPGGIQVLENHINYYDTVFLDKSVRVIAVSSLVEGRDLNGWTTTFVAQTRHERNEYIYAALIDASLRVLFLILVTSVLLYVGVSLGLRPLDRLQNAVHKRNPKDLSAFKYEDIPLEITGLVSELNDLLRRLAANISLTKRFVENAAHQLRTPVAALLPQSDLALRRAESERERLAVSKIKISAEKIARLTHQLLNLTNAEAIDMSEQAVVELDLASLVEQHVAAYRELNPHDSLRLDLQPATMTGVELSIDEVLDNLLDNARKYGGESQEVFVRTYVQNATSVLEVIDRGPGIPAEERAKVTERFYRLAKDTNGSGLGLAIVKEIVEAHHGKLEILNGSQDAGTCMRCTFPTTL